MDGRVLGVVLALGLSFDALAKETAESIAKKMIDRDDGQSVYSSVVLLTCGFSMNGGKRRCVSGKRKKVFESISMDFDKGERTKSLSLIQEPANELGVGFLQEDFEQTGKDSQQWMYLPAMKKLKRVVSADDGGPKTGSFFGSEIAYEDVEKRHFEDYSYKLLGEEVIDSRKTWQMEMTPTKARFPKTSYKRSVVWVDQQSFMPLKSDLFDKSGNLAKTFLSKSLKQVKGIWIATRQIVVNHGSSRMSMMKMTSHDVNLEIDPELFSTRSLNDPDFRGSMMKKVRKSAAPLN